MDLLKHIVSILAIIRCVEPESLFAGGLSSDVFCCTGCSC